MLHPTKHNITISIMEICTRKERYVASRNRNFVKNDAKRDNVRLFHGQRRPRRSVIARATRPKIKDGG